MEQAADTAIAIENVWKIFGKNADAAMQAIRDEGIGKQEVLEKYDAVVGVADASIAIRPGEIFCIMGLSGSGKSTLVRHINRLLEPTAGRIMVNGEDILGYNARQLRDYRNHRVAMVFQNFALLPHRSVLDNIALPLEIRDMNKNRRLEKAGEILSMVELDGWGNKFAHELSGGMQQRVGLARALAADPDVLLMDEPFSALDPLIRRQLQDEFIKLSAVMKKTTVFITHDLDEAVRVGERIAIMRDGRIVQTGTAAEIIAHPADDYVADFVSGISRLKILRANDIMQPLEAFKKTRGGFSADAQSVDVDENLTNIIGMIMKDDSPIGVKKSGKLTGVITAQDIFRAIIEGAETS